MKKIVDLSYIIEVGMLTFGAPWHPVVEISIMGRHSLEGRETRKVVLGSHTGTHVDAPAHFIPGGLTIDKTPLDVLIGRAHLIEFPDSPPMRKVEILDVKKQLGEKPAYERVVFRFDWSRHWGTGQYYCDWPYLSRELCEWLIESGVSLVGMDTPSPDNPYDNRASGNDSPHHKLFLQKGVTLVEYLCNLEAIGEKVFDLVALPLKIKDGDGAPARVVALVDDISGGKSEAGG